MQKFLRNKKKRKMVKGKIANALNPNRILTSKYNQQMLKSKHSAEMTIGTLVIIVLAIIVLVVLALGFGAGWSNLWGKITGYFSPVNVDSVKQSCQYACTTKSAYDYCVRTRDVITLKADGSKDKNSYKGFTCKELETETLGFEACNEVECAVVKMICDLKAGESVGDGPVCDSLKHQECNNLLYCEWKEEVGTGNK